MKKIEMAGKRFGRLEVIERVENTGHHTMFICRCDCGNLHKVRGSHLSCGLIVSCGCYQYECRKDGPNLIHGRTGTTEHKTWINIRERCYNPKHISFKYYGAKGVVVCERWSSFENFFEDMGLKPSPKFSIDRINPYGNYEPLGRWPYSSHKQKESQ